ncbi:MAG: hypothetical protein QME66_13615, partial [Candidatus Eisenbacteria bacterium]|nr:hypothetical protein [Candidatus Eisenbacteria bacterium]
TGTTAFAVFFLYPAYVLTILKVDIGDLQRVPVFGTDPLGSNEKSVNVTVTPSPIPGGGSVTLALSTLTGTGAATFDDGSTTKTITQTTTVKVRGTTNSSTKDNLKLAAQLAGTGCANDVFTVSTWPYEFRN